MTKFCPSCKQNKPISEFAKNSTKKDGLQVSCKECQKTRGKDYYQRTKPEHDATNKRNRLRNQLAVYEYLKTHPCVDCPISDPRVLTFDHVRGKKLGNVSDMIKRPCSLETIFREIAKCEVRCFNCHMIKDCSRPTGAVSAEKSWHEYSASLASPPPHTFLLS
jgi:hypothetical protein